MTTSLASSPVVPIATAVVAAGLIFGTLQNSSTASSDSSGTDTSGLPAAEIPGELPAAEIPAAPAAPQADTPGVVKQCAANACTITFPTQGGVANVLGTTVVATAFYKDGTTLTIGGTPQTSNLTVQGKGGGFTTKTVSVENGAASTHVVKVTKNKK